MDNISNIPNCLIDDNKEMWECFDWLIDSIKTDTINLEWFKKIDSTELFEENKKMFDFMIKTLLNSNNKKLETEFEKAIEKHIRAILLKDGIELDERLYIKGITETSITIDKTNLKKYNWILIDSAESDIVLSFWKISNIESINNSESFFSNNYSWKKLYDNPESINFIINNNNITVQKDNWIINFYKDWVKLKTNTLRNSLNDRYNLIFNKQVWDIYFFKSIWWRAILKTTENQLFDLETMERIDLNRMISEINYDELFSKRKYFNFILSIGRSDLFDGEIKRNFKIKLKEYLKGKGFTVTEDYEVNFSHKDNGYIRIKDSSVIFPEVREHIKIAPEKITILKRLKTIEEVKNTYFSWDFKSSFSIKENNAIETLIEKGIIINLRIRYLKKIGFLKNSPEVIKGLINSHNLKTIDDITRQLGQTD